MKNLLKVSVPEDGLCLNYKWNGNICDLTLTNHSANDLKLGDLILFTAEMPFSSDTKFWGEGFSMLSHYGGTIRDFKLTGPYSDYTHYKLKKPDDMNQVYSMIAFYPTDQEPVLLGFSSCFRFNGLIRFNEQVLQLALDCENITIAAGETIRLEQVYVEQGEKNTIFKHFTDAIAQNHPKLDVPEIPTGWCSWLVYGPGVTAQNIYDNLAAIKKHDLNLKYIQIDDGYQAHWGDWFDFTDKFEGGVQKLCLDIKEQGSEPAIWVAPFVAEKDSKVFQEHPDWFVQDGNGKPLSSGDVSFGGWRCAPWYILDVTHPEALNYVKKVFKTMHDEWQVKYFKLDAIVWECLPFGQRYDANKTGVEAYRLGMEAIIEAAGPDSFILGGNSPMWPSIGAVHGMRITNDNTRSWKQFKSLARQCFYRNWEHNRFWINDPDTVLLQNKMIKVMGPDGKDAWVEGSVKKEEFAFNAAYTMASGGMVLSGDDVSALTDDNITFLKKLIPSVEVAAELDDESFTIGRAKIDDTKTIIYVFNFEDEAKEIRIPIGEKLEVLDLFTDEKLGVCEKEIYFAEVIPHSAKVLICNKA